MGACGAPYRFRRALIVAAKNKQRNSFSVKNREGIPLPLLYRERFPATLSQAVRGFRDLT